jgi:hypothetical protein
MSVLSVPSLCHDDHLFPLNFGICQGRDSQNFLSKLLKIFVTISLKMSSLLEVKSIFKVYMIKF